MTRQQKAKHDQDLWADQLRLKAEALKTCVSSQADLNPKWIADVSMEIDDLMAHTIMLAQATAEDQL